MHGPLSSIGKLLVVAGLGLALLGLVLVWVDRVGGYPRIPGDIVLRKRNFTVYLPIGTSILLSLVLSLILWFLGRR